MMQRMLVVCAALVLQLNAVAPKSFTLGHALEQNSCSRISWRYGTTKFVTRAKHNVNPQVTKWCAGPALPFLIVLFVGVAVPRSTRIDLFPKLQVGQTLNYEVTYHSDKQTKTKSSIVLAQSPADAVMNVRALLRIEILSVAEQRSRAVVHARATFPSTDEGAPAKASTSGRQTDSPSPETTSAVEFTVFPDGRIDQVTGLDALSPDQLQAWQQWAARFAASAVFPADGIKPGEKWKSEESERSPSAIAGLTWIRESTYVRNEPCRPLRLTSQGELVESSGPSDTCAVILTTASLKQQSSANDATPDDYRVRQLRTTGTARGNNKTILYLSLRDGLVVRASDEADQAMSVTIAKTDGSNQVHYDVQAKSAAEVLLVTSAAP
jgi:hypothetical protein